MPKIHVHTAFNLLLDNKSDRVRFEPGVHDVSDEVAGHWYTKEHADIVSARAPRTVAPKVLAESAPPSPAAASETKSEPAQDNGPAKRAPPPQPTVEEKAERDAIRAKLTEMGDEKLPHHNAGLDKHRAALAEAEKAAAQ